MPVQKSEEVDGNLQKEWKECDPFLRNAQFELKKNFNDFAEAFISVYTGLHI